MSTTTTRRSASGRSSSGGGGGAAESSTTSRRRRSSRDATPPLGNSTNEVPAPGTPDSVRDVVAASAAVAVVYDTTVAHHPRQEAAGSITNSTDARKERTTVGTAVVEGGGGDDDCEKHENHGTKTPETESSAAAAAAAAEATPPSRRASSRRQTAPPSLVTPLQFPPHWRASGCPSSGTGSAPAAAVSAVPVVPAPPPLSHVSSSPPPPLPTWPPPPLSPIGSPPVTPPDADDAEEAPPSLRGAVATDETDLSSPGSSAPSSARQLDPYEHAMRATVAAGGDVSPRSHFGTSPLPLLFGGGAGGQRRRHRLRAHTRQSTPRSMASCREASEEEDDLPSPFRYAQWMETVPRCASARDVDDHGATSACRSPVESDRPTARWHRHSATMTTSTGPSVSAAPVLLYSSSSHTSSMTAAASPRPYRLSSAAATPRGGGGAGAGGGTDVSGAPCRLSDTPPPSPSTSLSAALSRTARAVARAFHVTTSSATPAATATTTTTATTADGAGTTASGAENELDHDATVHDTSGPSTSADGTPSADIGPARGACLRGAHSFTSLTAAAARAESGGGWTAPSFSSPPPHGPSRTLASTDSTLAARAASSRRRESMHGLGSTTASAMALSVCTATATTTADLTVDESLSPSTPRGAPSSYLSASSSSLPPSPMSSSRRLWQQYWSRSSPRNGGGGGDMAASSGGQRSPPLASPRCVHVTGSSGNGNGNSITTTAGSHSYSAPPSPSSSSSPSGAGGAAGHHHPLLSEPLSGHTMHVRRQDALRQVCTALADDPETVFVPQCVLGEGAVARVVRARFGPLNDVAVKVYRVQLSGNTSEALQEYEHYRLMASLACSLPVHRNVVTHYACHHTTGGRLAVVMECGLFSLHDLVRVSAAAVCRDDGGGGGGRRDDDGEESGDDDDESGDYDCECPSPSLTTTAAAAAVLSRASDSEDDEEEIRVSRRERAAPCQTTLSSSASSSRHAAAAPLVWRVDHPPFHVHEVIGLWEQVVQGVVHLHRLPSTVRTPRGTSFRGVWHRDLKSDNVICTLRPVPSVSSSSCPPVAAAGLARRRSSSPPVLSAGSGGSNHSEGSRRRVREPLDVWMEKGGGDDLRVSPPTTPHPAVSPPHGEPDHGVSTPIATAAADDTAPAPATVHELVERNTNASVHHRVWCKIADFDEMVPFHSSGLLRTTPRAALPVSSITAVAGTTQFQAPEVRRGEYDDRSDVWSLGMILFELLTGDTPYIHDGYANLFALQAALDRGVRPLWPHGYLSSSSGDDDPFSVSATAASVSVSGSGMEHVGGPRSDPAASTTSTTTETTAITAVTDTDMHSPPALHCRRLTAESRLLFRRLQQLFVECTQFVPADRPTASQVLERLRALRLSCK